MYRVLSVCILLFSMACAQTIELSHTEKAWIAKKQLVRISGGKGLPLYGYDGENVVGISVFFIQHILDKHHIEYTFSPLSLGTNPSLGLDEKHDLFITATIENSPLTLLSDSYYASPVVVFVNEDETRIYSMKGLNGNNVVIEENAAFHQWLKNAYPKVRFTEVGGERAIEKALKAVVMGEVKAYIGEFVMGDYRARKAHLHQLKIVASLPFLNSQMAMAVRHDWPELVSIINKELKMMPQALKDEFIDASLFVEETGVHTRDLIQWIGGFFVLFGALFVGVILSRGKRKVLQIELAQYMDLMDSYVITSSTDLKGVITQVSDAFCDISKYSRDELLGNTHRILRHPDMPASLYKGMWGAITKGKVWKGEIKNLAKDGTVYWVKAFMSPYYDVNGKIIGYISIRQDITDKKRVEELSITDSLTGLYNRRYFDEVLPLEINRAMRNNEPLTFMMADIDFFKQYNDTYGHQKGDEVLEAVSKVMQEHLQRANDYGFRVGGEEFGILMIGLDEHESLAFASQLREAIIALGIPHETSSASQVVTLSFGLTCKNAQEIDSKESLYKMTDDLLYEAKHSGRNCIKSNV